MRRLEPSALLERDDVPVADDEVIDDAHADQG